ncbi:MAG TPA: BON domain-containing protein [Burkholderiaceae bacterium]|nr:BON domain-containing protein [Burkholderiaceae bacterium]
MQITRNILAAAVTAVALLTTAGCAVQRKQESVGAYVDDTAITSQVKAKLAADKTVSALAISVETMKGTVQLSGFAKSPDEKMAAERIARSVSGVREVKNDIVVRA